MQPIHFDGENRSNLARDVISRHEPQGMRTYTPTQAVFETSSGVFHYTPEGRKLFDYSSGVLVANLGHNPRRWLQHFAQYMGWLPEYFAGGTAGGTGGDEYVPAVTLTAYNGVTEIETKAVERLLANLQASPGSDRLDTIMWAASGSEAVHKAIYTCLAQDRSRDIILATRYGFHGKKGFSNAVTGSETDSERDPRVKFIGFPMQEVCDHTLVDEQLPLERYHAELDALWAEHGSRICCLITEPYLGGGGSYHPPLAYHHLLQKFCRAHEVLLIFDEVQANFGRTGPMYAFEKYQIEPDVVVLGKGLGNGIPVAAVAMNRELSSKLKYGEASDTWSANPLSCAAVLATLDEFERANVLADAARLTPIFFDGLDRLKETGLIANVRGEGMVFGIECAAVGPYSANEVAARLVETCYRGADDVGIHFLGALAGKVLRVSPPLTMSPEEAHCSLSLLHRLTSELAESLTHEQLLAARQ